MLGQLHLDKRNILQPGLAKKAASEDIKYKRILLKLSGEALMGEAKDAVDPQVVEFIIKQIKEVLNLGIELGLVIGGGNFFRGVLGSDKLKLQRANADYIGMLATAMNGILLRDALNSHQIPAELYSAFAIGNIIEPYNRDKALKQLNSGVVVIFAGGVGSPFFTTDSGAALRAIEMDCSLLIKATKVNGIYNKDPQRYPDAVKYSELSFDQVINQNLGVMDMTAFALCRENNMNINVCSIFEPNILKRVVMGENEGTLVSSSIQAKR